MVPITELVDVCEQLAEHNRRLFEITGGWVTTETDAEVQRWWSMATHRHAWHAELWASRRPAVPIDAPSATAAVAAPDAAADTPDRVRWYLTAVARLAIEANELAGRVDADLDPATARVCRLVIADLDELRESAPSG